jgi:hypothetical protein
MATLNAYDSLLSRVNKMIAETMRSRPHSIIARVVSVNKNTVDLSNIDLKASNPAIIKNVPIMRPIYNHYPVKVGDVGVCLTIDYSVEPILKNSKLVKKALQENANGGGYFFFPIASDDVDFASDTMANEMYSLDGNTQYIIDNEKTELTDRFNNDILIDKDGVKVVDSNNNKIVISKDGVKIVDSNNNEIEMSASGVVIKNNSCQIEMSASGVNINNGALEIMP